MESNHEPAHKSIIGFSLINQAHNQVLVISSINQAHNQGQIYM